MPRKKKLKTAPQPSLRRLPKYLHLLKTYRDQGLVNITTSLISRQLRLDATQVRKDLAFTGVTGKPLVGFNIQQVIRAIETFLGWRGVTDAVLVGAGNLGSALLGYPRFQEYGLNFMYAFDIDPGVIGRNVHDVVVHHLESLVDLVKGTSIGLGIITVPADAAQSVADLLVQAEIKAIWNFAPVSITVPESILVQQGEIYAQLALLTHRLSILDAGSVQVDLKL